MLDHSRTDAQCAFRTDTSQERQIITSTSRSRGKVWTWRLALKGLANVKRIGVPDLQSSYTVYIVCNNLQLWGDIMMTIDEVMFGVFPLRFLGHLTMVPFLWYLSFAISYFACSSYILNQLTLLPLHTRISSRLAA
jgi:hypothetical protein